jgi:hypothetical protein
MLNIMPINNPKLTLDTNLNNYFGFCYAVITPPLKQHIIPRTIEIKMVILFILKLLLKVYIVLNYLRIL